MFCGHRHDIKAQRVLQLFFLRGKGFFSRGQLRFPGGKFGFLFFQQRFLFLQLRCVGLIFVGGLIIRFDALIQLVVSLVDLFLCIGQGGFIFGNFLLSFFQCPAVLFQFPFSVFQLAAGIVQFPASVLQFLFAIRELLFTVPQLFFCVGQLTACVVDLRSGIGDGFLAFCLQGIIPRLTPVFFQGGNPVFDLLRVLFVFIAVTQHILPVFSLYV